MRNGTTAIVRLEALTPAHDARAGAKASNCARLKQAGFPVPDGLVVLSDATDAEIADLSGDPWFEAVPLDATFAVRSSAIGEDSPAHSFAGIHQTLLNVRREDLVTAIAACRESAC